MSKVTFNTLVVYTIHGEVLDVFVGTDTLLLSQLKASEYWDTMEEEFQDGDFTDITEYFKSFSVEDISDFYQGDKADVYYLTLRVKYFPNKTIFYR